MFTTRTVIGGDIVFSIDLCVYVCLFVNARERGNSWTVWDIIMNVLWEQNMVKSSDEFENGCIPMHCGARVVI